MNDGLFHEADMAWIPRYIDILYKGDSGNPNLEERAYYQKFGFGSIKTTEFPYLTLARPMLKEMFDERYATRRIAYETLEVWQTKLQRHFDENAQKWEQMLELYSLYDERIKTDVVDGWKDSGQMGSIDGGSETTATSNKFIDTPDSAINANDDYADTLNKGSGTTTYGKTNNQSYTNTHEVKGDIAGMVNTAVDSYRNLYAEIVDSFENLFLNVFYY